MYVSYIMYPNEFLWASSQLQDAMDPRIDSVLVREIFIIFVLHNYLTIYWLFSVWKKGLCYFEINN